MTKREDPHLLSGAYALDAVTAEEAALIEVAMRDSEELRGEVVGLSDTAVALGLAVPPVEPPPALRARLLEAIEDLPQQTPEPDRESHDSFEPDPVLAMPIGLHQVPKRRRRARRPAVFLALAAAAVVLFTGGFFVQRTLINPQAELTAIQVSPDVHQASARTANGGKATVMWSKSEHRTAVVLEGVTAPSGKVLQLWSARGGTITDAGLYQPQDGQNFALISGTPTAGEQIMVSVEPAGGSPKPTTTPIAVVGLGV